jgi:hypothetical protein
METIQQQSLVTPSQLCYIGVSKTPDGFCNLETTVPATRCLRIDCNHVQCCLEFSFNGPLVNAALNCCSGIVYQNSKLQLYSMVSNSIFKDVMLQALVVLCYCGYQDGIKKDQ